MDTNKNADLPTKVSKKQLGEHFIQKAIINRPQLQQALQEQDRYRQPIGKIMVHMGLISEDDLISVLSEQLGLPTLNLDQVSIEKSLLTLIPKRVAKQFILMPVSRAGNVLTVVMDNPMDIMAIDTIRITTGCQVNRVLGKTEQIKRAIHKHYPKNFSEDVLPEDVLYEKRLDSDNGAA